MVADLRKGSEKGVALAKQILGAEKLSPQELRGAFEHYIEHWSNFTHVGLFSLACEAVGGNPDDSVITQAAIAMMVAAFDLHDDILDKSKTKDKIPTVYGKFGVEIALLLGNAFLIEGFKTFADSTLKLPKEKGKKALETTKNLFFEVGNAHSLEVSLKQSKKMTLNDYMMITELKAAAFEVPLMLGAFFGGGDEMEVSNLSRLGRILGMLGILRDDLVDVFDVEELRQRIAVQDLPLPLLFAMEDKKTNIKATTILSKAVITRNDVSDLVALTFKAKPTEEIKYEMQVLVEAAELQLNKLSNKNLRSKLQAVVSFMLEDLSG